MIVRLSSLRHLRVETFLGLRLLRRGGGAGIQARLGRGGGGGALGARRHLLRLAVRLLVVILLETARLSFANLLDNVPSVPAADSSS